ncbi:MAG: hypothetical protein PVF95_14155 [bacterium]|jgi:hypothetical protein
MNQVKVVFLVFLLLTLPSAAGAVPVVYCEPETSTVDSAEVFQVGVMVDQLDTLSNYQIIFTYDYTVLEFVDAYQGSLYANSGLQTWFTVEEESLGTWEVFDVIFPALTYLLPPGELCRLEFKALKTGFSPIEFISVALTDRYREGIAPLTWRDGFIVVGDLAGVEGGASRAMPPIGFPQPNPTRGAVTVPLCLCGKDRNCGITVGIYDTRGSFVAGLADRVGITGTGLVWDGCDSDGRKVPAGIYYMRANWPEINAARKIVIIK